MRLTNSVVDVNVEAVLCYRRRPDTLGQQWTSGKPAVNSQTTASATAAAAAASGDPAARTHSVPST